MNMQVKIGREDIKLIQYLVALCERRGITAFNATTYDENEIKDRLEICGYFGVYDNTNTGHTPCYALCTRDSILKGSALVYSLDTFIDRLKKIQKHEIQLNSEYSAIIDFDKRLVKVGCSSFAFDPIFKLVEAIKRGDK